LGSADAKSFRGVIAPAVTKPMKTQPQLPELKRVVLIGAGHAHLIAMRDFSLRFLEGAQLTVITHHSYALYSGMVPGIIAGHYSPDEARIDVGAVAKAAGASLCLTEAIGIDLANNRVICRDCSSVSFDLLSINTGSSPSSDVPGVPEHAISIKPFEVFLTRFETVRRTIIESGTSVRIGMVGAGAAGVELLLAIHHRLTREAALAGQGKPRLQFVLFSATSEILPSHPPALRRRIKRLLDERGIEVCTDCYVEAVKPGAVYIAGQGRRAVDVIFWAIQAAPPAWLRDTGLALDDKGFIRVWPTLESVSHPHIFAAGDVASIENHDLPRSGVYAVRQGSFVAANLRRAALGNPLTAYKPQRDALYLVSTGDRHAIGTRNGFALGGGWVWKLKDWIDRRYVRQFPGSDVGRG